MNLRDIRYLVAVADSGHFGHAAETCHVSQPTLSIQLKKLEETLGATLIERSNRKVMLTPVGEAVVERARAVLHASEEMHKIAKSANDPLAGEITLGVFPTLAPYLLPLIMPAIKKQFPRLTLRLVEEKTADLLTKLEAGEIDCALLALPLRHHALETAKLFDEPFYLAVPAAHPLAARKHIDEEELQSHALLLLDEGHCLREQALEVCRRIGVQESQNFRATSLETLREMVAAGSAATLIPRLAVRAQKEIRYIPFKNPAPARHVALCWRKTTSRKLLMEKLSPVISDTIKPVLARKLL